MNDANLHTQEILLLVAPPASGKSTLAEKFEEEQSYERINQDTLKTEEKCFVVAREALTEKKRSIIIDNTNITIEKRRKWIQLATELNIPVS